MSKNRHIWEGWTVQHFIDELEVTFPYQKFKSKEDLKKWCKSEQPYYKKHIPEVYNYFLKKSNLKNQNKDEG
jgi:hypothetical protein